MNLNLENKVAIVTGGASGIGKATVLKLAEEGAIPVFIDKDVDKAGKLSSELTCRHLYIPGNIVSEEVCFESIKQVIKKYGKIDILINNAGINDRCDIDDTTSQQFRDSLEINLVHYYSMTHYTWPHLKKSKGNIIFIGSKVSLVGEGLTIAYAAAKGAINAMTRELATKSVNENLGIRVNCVLPGIVSTPLYEEYIKDTYGDLEKGNVTFGKRIPLGQRPTTAEEVANYILFLASDLSSHITAQLTVIDGGYVHLDRNVRVENYI